MNPTTYTIESVHGIKQTVVLTPNSDRKATESATTPVAPESKRDEQNFPRSSK